MNPASHLFWLTSRAAGTAAMVLSSLALTVGLTMGGRLLGSARVRGPDLLTMHEALSLAAIGMLALHGVALLGDPFLHPGILDLLVPFAGRYRPLWNAIGIAGGWGFVVLGLSYYARTRIGVARWRVVHRFIALAWLAGAIHTLGSGSDAQATWYLVLLAAPAAPLAVMLPLRLRRARGRRASGTGAASAGAAALRSR